MKVWKRFFSGLLCFVFVMACVTIPANAQEREQESYILQKAYDFLQIASEDANAYGLQEITGELTLSQEIPAYIFSEGALFAESDVSYYFILEDEQPVAELATLSRSDDQAPAIQFSTALSNTYQEFGDESFTIGRTI